VRCERKGVGSSPTAHPKCQSIVLVSCFMSTCAECGQRGRDCCHLLDEATSARIGFTVSDLIRIKQFTGKRPSEYATIEQLNDEQWDAVQVIPRAKLMFPHRIRMAPTLTAGACSLLTPTGCPMPVGVRPRYCALYPCWYDPDDEYALLPFYCSSPERCLVIERADNDPEKLFQLLSIGPQLLTQIAKTYHSELLTQAGMAAKQIYKVFGK
jgi:hypothetical protein